MPSAGVKFPFEFCALRYLLQWQMKEENLHALIKSSEPELSDIRKALGYFQVARNFTGLKQDDRAELIRAAMLEIRAMHDLSPECKVTALAETFKSAGFQHNISAASKLLWLSSKKPFIIYDSRTLSALKIEYGHVADQKDYQSYCASWKKAYRRHETAIKKAVNELPKARSFLPAATPPNDRLLVLVNKSWFRERTFDNYLWELGGGL